MEMQHSYAMTHIVGGLARKEIRSESEIKNLKMKNAALKRKNFDYISEGKREHKNNLCVAICIDAAVSSHKKKFSKVKVLQIAANKCLLLQLLHAVRKKASAQNKIRQNTMTNV